MRDLRDLAGLLLGFLPWLLFLFLSGHTLASLERGIIISLAVSVVFGLGGLKRGFILQWGTLVFFAAAFVLVNIMKTVWVAENMGVLTNLFLAGLMWFTVIIGIPFALQYARAGLPKEQRDDPNLVRGSRFITIVWAVLMTISTAVAVFRKADLVSLPEWVYFDISLLIIFGGLGYTTLFRRKKRAQRERMLKPAGSV